MKTENCRPRIGLYCLDLNLASTSSIGLYNYARQLIRTLAETPDPGFDLVLLVSSHNRNELTPAQLPGWITCKCIHGKYSNGFRRLLADHLLSALLAKKEHLDAVHFPKTLSPVFFPSNCRIICTIADTIAFSHDPIPGKGIPFLRRIYFQWLTRRALKKADSVITISEYSRTKLLALGCREDINVIYPGTGIQCTSPASVSPDRKTQDMLILGSYAPHKATGETIRLLGQYAAGKNKPISLNIASIDRPDPAWMPASRLLTINFPGRLSDQQLSQLMNSSRALIYLSVTEGFGLPCIEAYECGTPVCFRNSTSLAEIMQDIPGGWDGLSPESFFAAMDTVLNLPPDKVSEYRELLRSRFNWKKTASQTLQIYRKIIMPSL